MVDYYTARVDFYSVAQETVKATVWNSVGTLLTDSSQVGAIMMAVAG